MVLLTEHDRGFSEAKRLNHRAACAAASSERVLLLSGIEYSDPSNRVHVLVWGDIPFIGEGVPTGDLLKRVREAGGVAVLAHPGRRRAAEMFAPEWWRLLDGIEVWNRKVDGWSPARLALRLMREHRVSPTVGLDFHNARHLFRLAMGFPRDSECSEASILNAIRRGRARPTVFGCPLRFATTSVVSVALRLAERWRQWMESAGRRA